MRVVHYFEGMQVSQIELETELQGRGAQCLSVRQPAAEGVSDKLAWVQIDDRAQPGVWQRSVVPINSYASTDSGSLSV